MYKCTLLTLALIKFSLQFSKLLVKNKIRLRRTVTYYIRRRRSTKQKKRWLFLVRKILSLLSRGITQVIHTFVKVWHLSTRKFMLLASTPQQGRLASWWRPAIFSLHHFSWMDGAKVFRIMQNYSNKRKILPRPNPVY